MLKTGKMDLFGRQRSPDARRALTKVIDELGTPSQPHVRAVITDLLQGDVEMTDLEEHTTRDTRPRSRTAKSRSKGATELDSAIHGMSTQLEPGGLLVDPVTKTVPEDADR